MKKFIILWFMALWTVMSAVAANYKGDLNGDGKVDMADMAKWSQYCSTTSTNRDSKYDLNADGKFDNNDLNVLANLIINMTLTEDSGVNVGIGGWDEDDEDYGGSVGSIRHTPIAHSESSFYFEGSSATYNYSTNEVTRNPIMYGGNKFSGVLIDLKIPNFIVTGTDKINLVTNNGISTDHQFFGTPKIIRIDGEEHVRFIIYSPTQSKFSGDGELFSLTYRKTNNNEEGDINTGTCQAVSDGNSQVSEFGGNIYYCNWTYVPLTSISFEETIPTEGILLSPGDKKHLGLRILPNDATNKGVEWISSNESVAKADGDKQDIEAISPGEAIITVKSLDGSNLSCSAKIIVETPNVLVSGISIGGKPTGNVHIGDSFKLDANISPDNASNKDVTWISSNSDVATVDANGNVITKSIGETNITVSTLDGSNLSDSFTLQVLPIQAESISISGHPNGDIHIGDNFKLTATVLPENTTNKSVTWTSSDSSVATIDAEGNVQTVGVGNTIITATTSDGSNKSAKVTLNVLPISIKNIEITPSESDLKIGETIQLTATVYPDNATDKKVTWSSANTAVATVNASGLVTALSVGETTITATASDGSGLNATAVVRVHPILAESVSISGMPSGDIHIGDNFRLTATVLPENTTDKSVTWSTSDSSVASVDADGTVRAIAQGEAVITATSADGSNRSAQVTVSVKPNLADRIVIDPSEADIRIGETAQITATVYPDNTTDKKVTWSSSNTAVATVNASGLVTALSVGETTITATASDGSGLNATAVVRVHPILVENIVIEGLPEGELQVGDKFQLKAIVYPEEATDTSVSWSSDNENVAAVDADGSVEILAEGSTVIRATANDGSECEAICYIDVVCGVEMQIDAGKPFRVYDIQGHLLLRDADKRDLDKLTKGIYILVQSNNTCKFVR